MTNYLHTIAEHLYAAADDLERVAGRCICQPYQAGTAGLPATIHNIACPERTPTLEHHWAAHFRSDAQSIRLLAEAYQEAVTV